MKVRIEPAGHTLDTQPGERILDAAQRLGYDVPQSCRNGNCHLCSATLLQGRAGQREELIEQGELLSCIAEPLEDLVLHWEGVLAPDELPMRELSCQLVEATPLGADVWRVRLRTPAGKPLRYHAGQYLLLERPDGEVSAFSIASAPHEGRIIELHIQARDQSALALVEHLRRDRFARMRGPFGDCCLPRAPQRELVMIAAGTGLAQIQSMVEYCLAQGLTHPLHLYWGARQADDFYAAPHWPRWTQQSGIRLHQLVSDDDGFEGRKGVLAQAVLEDLTDLTRYDFYVCGSPGMVYGTLDALVEGGMPAEQMYSDVFAYAPRS
jgi:CDP-4-dehydro-6-deoxyglucose reductase, E3